MRRFLVELAVFLAMQAVVFGSFLMIFFGLPEENHYLAFARDKQARLESLESPRIIIAGDSGVAYGVHSPMIDQAFPEYEVVNMALMAGLGLNTILGEIEDEFRPGDIVVLILAYQMFDREMIHQVFWNYAAYRPEMILKQPPETWPTLLDTAFYFIQRAAKAYIRGFTWDFHPDREGPNNYQGFNQYGDLVAHYELPPTDFMVEFDDLNLRKKGYVGKVIRELNAFNRKAEASGAQVYFMFPAISQESLDSRPEEIEFIQRQVAEQLDFPVLGDTGELIFPLSVFYDSFYHLNGEAAAQRTQLIIDGLKAERAVAASPLAQ